MSQALVYRLAALSKDMLRGLTREPRGADRPSIRSENAIPPSGVTVPVGAAYRMVYWLMAACILAFGLGLSAAEAAPIDVPGQVTGTAYRDFDANGDFAFSALMGLASRT